MRGVINIDKFEDNTAKSLCTAAALDCLYKGRCLTLFTPLHFARNLVNYQVSGSKLLCTLNSRASPVGSYTTGTKWLDKESLSPLPAPPAVDISTYFDNNQVLVRNWRVRCDATVAVSVITSVMHIVPSIPTTLQTQPELSPSSWLYRPNVDYQLVCDKIHAMNIKCDDTFRRYRNKFISDRISEVYRQQVWRNGTIVDFIDGDAAKGYVPQIGEIYDKVESKHAPNSAPKH